MCHRDKFNPLAKRFDMLEFNQTKILSDFLFNQNFEENQYARKLYPSLLSGGMYSYMRYFC